MIPLQTIKNFALRFVQLRAGLRLPLLCSYLVNSDCNLNCMGCSFNETFASAYGGGDADADTGKALDIVRALTGSRTPVIIFAGGEPLLRDDIFELGSAARRGGAFSVLVTNGTLIDGAAAEKLGPAFHRIVVSLDGPEAENDAIRGPGSYAAAVDGLRAAVRAAGAARVIVACVINRYNIGSLSGFVHEMKELGAGGVKFQLNYLPELQPDPARARAGLDELAATKRKLPRFVLGPGSFFRGMADYLDAPRRTSCLAAERGHVAVSPDGAFHLCCYYPSALPHVTSPAMLAAVSREECGETLAGCPGCYRYDEQALSVFYSPLSRIRPAGILGSARV